MATVLSPPEQRIILRNVSWETYKRLLADNADSSNPRFAYDRGVLEIMSPSAEHEELSHVLTLLVNVVAEELDIDIQGFGSTTFRREDLARGFEPDSCFYIQSVERVVYPYLADNPGVVKTRYNAPISHHCEGASP